MTLDEGRRVRLAEDLAIGEAVAGEPGAAVGFLSLGAGAEGTVERVDGELPESTEVREYQRLKALFEDYGHTMPAASRERLETEIAALEPHVGRVPGAGAAGDGPGPAGQRLRPRRAAPGRPHPAVTQGVPVRRRRPGFPSADGEAR